MNLLPENAVFRKFNACVGKPLSRFDVSLSCHLLCPPEPTLNPCPVLDRRVHRFDKRTGLEARNEALEAIRIPDSGESSPLEADLNRQTALLIFMFA